MEISPRLYPIRSQAANAARRAGHAHFKTIKMPQGWRWAESVASPAIELIGRDYVAWVEAHHIDEGHKPGHRGVVIVTCAKDEIPAEDIALGFEFQPITAEAWDLREAPRRREVDSSTTENRARSDVASPTKLVWEIADSMPDADRKAVVEACVAAGVNKATASTQYYRWQKSKSA